MRSHSNLALAIALLGCAGPSHETATVPQQAAAPVVAKPDAGVLTLTSDDEFIANGREIVRRLAEIFTNDGQDCEKLAADISKLSEDPIWPASTTYEDGHPDVKERFAAEQAELAKQYAPVARQAMAACAKNAAFADALAKMR
jgi:hypothetical protein